MTIGTFRINVLLGAIAGLLALLGLGSIIPVPQKAFVIGGLALYVPSTIIWLIGAKTFRTWPLFSRSYGYFMAFMFGFLSMASFLFKVHFEAEVMESQFLEEAQRS